MRVRLAVLVVLLTTGCAPVHRPTPHATTAAAPAWAADLPTSTSQVVRTISSDRWCTEVYCTVTEAWERDPGGGWTKLRTFRSSIGPTGWGKIRQDDGGTPDGVFGIKVTFSTGEHAPGAMPWRRRLPTSTVSEKPPDYNTWIEETGRTDGDRPSMRYGFVVDFNHVRLQPGVGPAPVPNAGSGIFYHTSRPGHRWEPSAGCTRVGNPDGMRWLLAWLRPGAHPLVVQGR